MEWLVAVIATVAVGALIAFQPPVNSGLGKRTTVLAAAFMSTAISTLVMALIVVAAGQIGNVRRVPHIPLVYLTGGLLGAALVLLGLERIGLLRCA
jgi:uncharacterized membrane protein YdcZ (DUF606 family)